MSIKQARNLSQNARNGHFRDSNFQNFLGGGGMPLDPPRNLASSALVGAPLSKSWIRPCAQSVFTTLAALHSIFAHTGSLKLYDTMLIGYAENDVLLHLSLSQCLKLLILKRLFFKDTVVKIAVTIQT